MTQIAGKNDDENFLCQCAARSRYHYDGLHVSGKWEEMRSHYTDMCCMYHAKIINHTHKKNVNTKSVWRELLSFYSVSATATYWNGVFSVIYGWCVRSVQRPSQTQMTTNINLQHVIVQHTGDRNIPNSGRLPHTLTCVWLFKKNVSWHNGGLTNGTEIKMECVTMSSLECVVDKPGIPYLLKGLHYTND